MSALKTGMLGKDLLRNYVCKVALLLSVFLFSGFNVSNITTDHSQLEIELVV